MREYSGTFLPIKRHRLPEPGSMPIHEGISKRADINIKAFVRPDAKFLEINLLHDAPEFHENSWFSLRYN